jgi:hypothetical protein
VKGVSEGLVREFSKRSRQIAEALPEGPRDAKAAAKVTLETRTAKRTFSRAELFAAWQEVGRRHGFEPEKQSLVVPQRQEAKPGELSQPAARVTRSTKVEQRQDAGPAGIPLPPRRLERPPIVPAAARQEIKAAMTAAAERLTASHAHFSEGMLARQTFAGLPGGHRLSVVKRVVRQEVQSLAEIVLLGRGGKGERRYTTRAVMELEESLLRHAEALDQKATRPLSPATVSRAIRKHRLTGEREKAFRHLVRPTGIAVLDGLAGTGKTALHRAIAEAYEREGRVVVGVALSGKAASELEERAGVKSVTVAKLLRDLEKGPLDTARHHARQLVRQARKKPTFKEDRIRLDPRTVLVLDEAGMVGTGALARMLEAANKAHCKVILSGDSAQLSPIEAGAPFQALAKQLGSARLTEVVRQKDPRDRENVSRLARGEARKALDDYALRGLLRVAPTRSEAMEELIGRWKLQGARRPEEHLILATTNSDVRELNLLAQAERRKAWEPGFGVRISRSGFYLGRPALRCGGGRLFEGDRCLFTANSKLFGVRNGDLGTVVRIDPGKLTLTAKLDGGRTVVVPIQHYGDENVRLGYAVTSHRAQGATVENAYVLVGGPLQHKELGYVQASRAAGTTMMFVGRVDAGPKLARLYRQMEESRAKDLAQDVVTRDRGRELSPEIER